MRSHTLQVFMITLVSASSAFILWPERFPEERFQYHDGPPLQAPHPLVIPPPQLHLPPPLHHGPSITMERLPFPVVIRGVFPPFVERIVQRIQTFWSVYNPPELLTRPPTEPPYTPRPPAKKKPSTTTTSNPTSPTDVESTAVPTESTTSPSVMETTSPPRVATLAVFEVTPSTDSAEVATTIEPPDLPVTTEDAYIDPEKAGRLFYKFLESRSVPKYTNSESIDPIPIDPEKGSLLFLKYLESGKLPTQIEPEEQPDHVRSNLTDETDN